VKSAFIVPDLGCRLKVYLVSILSEGNGNLAVEFGTDPPGSEHSLDVRLGTERGRLEHGELFGR